MEPWQPPCPVCGGRPAACALLGHRAEKDRNVKWQQDEAIPSVPLPPLPNCFMDLHEYQWLEWEKQMQDYARLAVAEHLKSLIGDCASFEEFLKRYADAAVAEATASWQKAEHDLSDAYLRLKKLIPGAFDTPSGPTGPQVWEHTERCLQKMAEERDSLAGAMTAETADVALSYASCKRERNEAIRERDQLRSWMAQNAAAFNPNAPA